MDFTLTEQQELIRKEVATLARSFAPWGQYVQPQVFSKKVRGTLKFVTPVMWNVWLES